MNNKRRVKKTALVVTEGYREFGFQNHIKKLYHHATKSITIKNGHGGSPKKTVERSIAETRYRNYEEQHVIFDTDRGYPEVAEAEELANKENVCVHKSVPNIDLELIRILTNEKKLIAKAGKNPDEAKKILQKLCRNEKPDSEIDWERFFPKDLLDDIRSKNPWLNDQIKIHEK